MLIIVKKNEIDLSRNDGFFCDSLSGLSFCSRQKARCDLLDLPVLDLEKNWDPSGIYFLRWDWENQGVQEESFKRTKEFKKKQLNDQSPKSVTCHGYFVLHAVCSACSFVVNGNFILFFWVNGNFIFYFVWVNEHEFWKKINSMWFLSYRRKDLKCVVCRRRRPYLLSSHVSTLVTSQHFNV